MLGASQKICPWFDIVGMFLMKQLDYLILNLICMHAKMLIEIRRYKLDINLMGRYF